MMQHLLVEDLLTFYILWLLKLLYLYTKGRLLFLSQKTRK